MTTGADSARPSLDGQLCLVTGASSGLGAAIAMEAARRGADLVLTARRLDRLDALAADIAAAHGTRCTIIPADLSAIEGNERLLRRLGEEGLSPDILVLNAGAVRGGGFLQPGMEDHLAFETLMVRSPMILAHALMPAMAGRGAGRVLLVSSVAAFTPGTAGSPLYGASKAFLTSFGQSLADEGARSGIRVRVFCPGIMETAIFDGNGMSETVKGLPGFMKLEVGTAARRALDSFDRTQTVIVPGLFNKLLVTLARTLPLPLAGALARRQSSSRGGG